MPRWILFFLAVMALAAPTIARAQVPVATGGGSVTMREVDEPTSVYQVRYYTLVGTFTVGKKIYRGKVTGQWSQDLYSRGGEFSGNNGKHSFTASACDFRTGLPDETLAETTPSGRSELYTCSADIDGTDHAQIALYFQYIQMYPSGDPCCLWAWKGVFVGV